jgi:hypothetical protein
MGALRIQEGSFSWLLRISDQDSVGLRSRKLGT